MLRVWLRQPIRLELLRGLRRQPRTHCSMPALRRREPGRPVLLQLVRDAPRRDPGRKRVLADREAARGRRGAKAGNRALRRRTGIDGPRRAGGSRGLASDHAAILLAALGRRAPLRGNGRQVHGRRDHGGVRRADRARGPRCPSVLRRTSHRRAGDQLRHRASPGFRAQLLGPHRDQLGRSGRREYRRGQRAGVHGRRPHGRAGPANGGARGAGEGLPHGAHREARRGIPGAEGPRRVRDRRRDRPWALELVGVGRARSRRPGPELACRASSGGRAR